LTRSAYVISNSFVSDPTREAFNLMTEHEDSRFEDPDGGLLDCLYCDSAIFMNEKDLSYWTEAIDRDGNNLKARLRLLGYYRKFLRPPESIIRQKHIFWMIEHRPSDFVCLTEYMAWTEKVPKLYREVKRSWRSQIDRNPNNASILASAGAALIYVEPRETVDFLEKALQLEPDNNDFREVLLRAIGFINFDPQSYAE
jgi:hypothetical protein